jgi:hypothetical protein
MNILKRIIFCTVGSYLLITASVQAQKNKVLLDLVKKNLHPKVSNLFLKAKNIQDIEGALGSADLVEGKKKFYIIGGFKYSLSITIDKNSIKNMRFRLPTSGSPYTEFSRYLNSAKVIEGDGTHSEGRYFSQTDTVTGIKLVFKNNSKKNLYSITRTIRDKE